MSPLPFRRAVRRSQLVTRLLMCVLLAHLVLLVAALEVPVLPRLRRGGAFATLSSGTLYGTSPRRRQNGIAIRMARK